MIGLGRRLPTPTGRLTSLLLGLAMASSGWAAPPVPSGNVLDLTHLSIEELMHVKITSASKKPQKLLEVPAAVYVNSRCDLLGSGATNIPDLLRLVPGVQVARIDANKWAISSRGFNGRFSNKLLVLIDGRRVYSPLFSGVTWNSEDTFLHDVERIEVIRGPGGTLWGANAVNGVINIITRHSRETQGGVLKAGAGSEESGFGWFRYGGKTGENAYSRVYAKYHDRDGSIDAAGADVTDGWDMAQGGFRFDIDSNPRDSWTVQGNYYGGGARTQRTRPSLTAPFAAPERTREDISGGNATLQLTRTFDSDSDMVLRLYYDKVNRDVLVQTEQQIFDLDFQRKMRLDNRDVLVWGLGYRATADQNSLVGTTFALSPLNRKLELFSAFAQNEHTFDGDRWRLLLGTKVEHNDFTGVEVQPSVRLLHLPERGRALWAAVSRAVRVPSRAEFDGQINQTPFLDGTGTLIQPRILGNRGYQSEELLATELGYRFEAAEDLSLDLTGFVNFYDNLRTLEPAAPFPEAVPGPAHVVQPLVASNELTGETYGLEIAGDWQVRKDWKMRFGYTLLDVDLSRSASSGDTMALSPEGESPSHQVFTRSHVKLNDRLSVDGALRFVDDLPSLGISSYVTADLRVAWKARDDILCSLVGRNLLDDSHPEFVSSLLPNPSTQVERSLFGDVTYRF